MLDLETRSNATTLHFYKSDGGIAGLDFQIDIIDQRMGVVVFGKEDQRITRSKIDQEFRPPIIIIIKAHIKGMTSQHSLSRTFFLELLYLRGIVKEV
jgi:hypothetical protein